MFKVPVKLHVRLIFLAIPYTHISFYLTQNNHTHNKGAAKTNCIIVLAEEQADFCYLYKSFDSLETEI